MDAEKIFTKIPVTILTGFLGAGKTTLLNHLLRGDHGQKIAVIVNEFGAVGIDGALVVGGEEQLVTLDNGCICCTVRNDLVETLTSLVTRKLETGERKVDFDRVVIETTGLADPIPLLQTFMLDEVLATCFAIESVITVVDGVALEQELRYLPVAAEQIAQADLVLLNKCDQLDEAAKTLIEARIRDINPLVEIMRASFGQVPIGDLFLERRLATDEALRKKTEAHQEESHDHLDGIVSTVLSSSYPIEIDRLYNWIGEMQNHFGPDLLRYKGIVLTTEHPEKRSILQGVHTLYSLLPDRVWQEAEKRETIIVVIGRDLDTAWLEESFQRDVVGQV